MKIAIVDDSPDDLEVLATLLNDYAASKGLESEIAAFPSGEEFLENWRPQQYTVIFLDIYMRGITGIETARAVRQHDPDTLIVFLTSGGDHMPEAFSLHAFDYIIKPADERQIFRVMDDILKIRVEHEVRQLTFYSSKQDHSLPYGDIVSVITDANYLEITDCRGEVYKTRMTFSAAMELLGQDTRFLRLLRGVMVNMDYIASFGEDTCRMKGGRELPINVRSRKEIEQTWRNYVFRKIRGESMKRGGDQ